MLCQQKAEIHRARTLLAAPVLHSAKRDAHLLCKSGLRQASTGHHLSHVHAGNIPEMGQADGLGVQIKVPFKIVRDAEGDVTEKNFFRLLGSHAKKFCIAVHG